MAKNRKRTKTSGWKQGLASLARGMLWCVLGAVAALAAYDLYRFLFVSEFFVVSEVEIEGCRYTNPGEMLELADVRPGQNMFQVPCGQIAGRLELHPWIVEARVARRLPQTIRVVVQERKPLAAVNSAYDGKIYGIDRDLFLLPEPGRAVEVSELKSEQSPAFFRLPIVTGLPSEELYPGNRLVDRRARKAIEVLLLLNGLGEGYPEKLSEIHIAPDETITIFPLEGIGQIHLGKKNLKQRILRLCQVWSYLDEHKIECRYVDCRFDRQGVVTRPTNLTVNKWKRLPQEQLNFVPNEQQVALAVERTTR